MLSIAYERALQAPIVSNIGVHGVAMGFSEVEQRIGPIVVSVDNDS